MTDITVSHALWSRLNQEFQRNTLSAISPLHQQQNLFRMPVRSSGAFPHQFDCGPCGGSGEGKSSTYCPKCKGAGEVKVIGIMVNCDPVTMIIEPLPKKFEPYFPCGIVPAPPICRGLP